MAYVSMSICEEPKLFTVSINGITIVFDKVIVCPLYYAHLYKRGVYICAIYEKEVVKAFLIECDMNRITVEREAI